MKRILKEKRRLLVIAVALCVAVIVAGIWLMPEAWHDEGRRWFHELLEWVRTLPFPLFILMVGVLPMMGVPITSFYLAAGAVYLPVYGLAVTLAGVVVGLLLNLLLCWVCAALGRGWVLGWMERMGWRMPTISAGSAWKLALMVRITPGAPMVAQNFILSLLKVPFLIYLGISVPVETLISLGYLAVGHSFGSGHWQYLVIGAGLIGMTLLGMNLMAERSKSSEGEGA